MTHLEILRDIAERGLTLSVSNGDLRLQGPRGRADVELVGRIKACKPALIAHLQAAERAFPLTELQRAYLAGRDELFEIGGVASHVYHEIEGAWDIARLERALNDVVARQHMLRTGFFTDGRQACSEAPRAVKIVVHDLCAAAPDEQCRWLSALREQLSHRMLALDAPPLVAVDVSVLGDEWMIMHVSHDGLVMDGISMFLFFKEWWSSYQEPAAPRPPLQTSFEAYVRALKGLADKPPTHRARDYWLARLDSLPPAPQLPLRASPSAIRRPRFSQRLVCVDADRWRTVKEHGAQAGLSPSAVLMAAYAEVLSAWGAGDRFTLNTTIADRLPIHPDIYEVIGNFTTTLLLEMALDRDLDFRDRARALQAQLRRDLEHRRFSGIAAMRELGRRRADPAAARMPFTFNSAIGYVKGDIDGSTLELFGRETFSVSQTPQIWLNAFAMEQHGGLVVQLDGVDELFPDGMLDAMADGYCALLTGLADGETWRTRVFDLLPEEQKARRRAANDTAAPVPAVRLQDAFLAQAERDPLAVAIRTATMQMSYGELRRRALHAAAWLRANGVGRNELVGLVMTRGPEQIVSILAVLVAGAAYLPIDATLPADRIRYLLDDGRVRCVLSNVREPVVGARPTLLLDATLPCADGTSMTPPADAEPSDLAYVLYTSGTTGAPKGVMVTHHSVVNVVADANARFAVEPSDRFLAVSAFSFDLSVYDIFGALSAGAALVLPDHDRAADPAHWLELCRAAGVTILNSVPAVASMLADEVAAGCGRLPPTLRLTLLSGDRIPPALPRELHRMRPDLAVVSLGGPTETTIWNIVHPISAADEARARIPYGQPNRNNRYYVLHADGSDAPDWVPGELFAAGAGLAQGYWSDTAQSAQRFFFDERRQERLYRTGDVGRYLPDGNIEILGRNDLQVKINGYRIEPGEIESRLCASPFVRQAAVVRRAGVQGDKLAAFLVRSTDTGLPRDADVQLRDVLGTRLPHYMIPVEFIWLDQMPLTANGKVDRARLAAAEVRVQAEAPAAGDQQANVEAELMPLWCKLLRCSEIDRTHSFYALGGDSITAARLAAALRKQFGVSIPLEQFRRIDSIQAMAAHICAATRTPVRSPAAKPQPAMATRPHHECPGMNQCHRHWDPLPLSAEQANQEVAPCCTISSTR
jgi:amino acid adenylation domain-containing protein